MPFTGSSSKVISYYRGSHILLNPSYCETFGYTTAEALICGIPVVAFDHSGSKSIVNHMRTGFLATPFSPQSFSYGIDWVTQNINILRSNIFDMARNKLLPGQNHQKIISDHLDIYEKTMDRFHSS